MWGHIRNAGHSLLELIWIFNDVVIYSGSINYYTMKKRIFYIIVVLCSLTSCGFLDETNFSELSGDVFFNSPENVNFAVLGCYDALQSVAVGFNSMTEVVSDHTCTGIGTKNATEITWQSGIINYADTWVTNTWNQMYHIIYRCNLVLDNIDKVEMESSLANCYKGEAHFIRGWAYLMLTNLYKDVPKRISSMYNNGIYNCPVSSQQEIYKLIFDDFKFAEDNLYDFSYGRVLEDSNGEYSDTQKGRVTKDAAIGMQALAYLYRAKNDPASEDWKNAWEKSKQLIERRGGIDAVSQWLSPTFGSLFRAEGKYHQEHLFGIYYSNVTGEGASFGNVWGVSNVYTMALYNGNRRYTEMWYTKYFGGKRDNRNVEMIHHEYEYSNGKKFYWPNINNNQFVNEVGRLPESGRTFRKDGGPWLKKFDDPDASVMNNTANGLPLLRYADVLLIFAEAENELNNGPTPDAYKAINAVRKRAGAVENPIAPQIGLYPAFFGEAPYENPSMSMTKEEFLEAILDERFMEFSQESKRFFDLNRREIYGVALAATKNANEFVANNVKRDNRVDVKSFYFPIPKTEIDSNRDL